MQRFTVPGKGGHMAGLNFGRGSGPIDIVFVHATGFCALTYRRLLAPLGDGLRVVALDMRGHGHTTLPARPFALTSWYTFARDLVAALGQIGAGQPVGVIAGHSMGGTTAMLALEMQPALARALLMVDPAMVAQDTQRLMKLPFMPHLMRRRIPIARTAGRRRADFPAPAEVLGSYQGRGAFKTWLPGFLEDYVEDGFVRRADGSVTMRCTPAWESATFAAQRHDLRAAMRALKVPARMLVAERGSTSERVIPLMNALAPAVAIERVPGSTHFVPMEQPELVRARMLALL